MTISLSSLGKTTLIAGVSLAVFEKAVSARPTASNMTPPNVTTGGNAISTNVDENPKSKSPSNTPIAASGNAAYANTAIKKSNEDVKHVCSVPESIGKALNMAGAMGGQIILAVRNAIKTALAALGIQPSNNGFVSFLKTITGYIKDITKFINDITKFINGLVVYVNAIKQLISYILSLPAQLLVYFAGCLQDAYRTLKEGYIEVLTKAESGTTEGDGYSSVISAAKEVLSSTGDLIKSSLSVTQSAVGLGVSALTAGQVQTDPTAQAAATQQVFAAAGFSNTSGNYSRP